MFVVDTNVLLYAVNGAAPEHRRCRALVEAWRKDASPWFLTWGILYEFLRVSTHPRVFPSPLTSAQSWSFVSALLAGSAHMLLPTERHPQVAAAVIDATPAVRGNLFHDLETVVLMREHGISAIYTRDTDLHRFRGIRVIDPLVD